MLQPGRVFLYTQKRAHPGGALPRRSSAGPAIAAVLGYLVGTGGTKHNFETFSNITGILLVLFAAGPAGKAIPEFRKLIEWESGVHDFLKALFRLTPAPERLPLLHISVT